MSFNLSKDAAPISNTSVTVPLTLDVLKLVEKTVTDVLSCVSNSFHSNGVLAETTAVKNLHMIKGEMAALKNLLAAIDKT
jgi:hypothetical protein